MYIQVFTKDRPAMASLDQFSVFEKDEEKGAGLQIAGSFPTALERNLLMSHPVLYIYQGMKAGERHATSRAPRVGDCEVRCCWPTRRFSSSTKFEKS